jgi:ubiquitin-protein ligase
MSLFNKRIEKDISDLATKYEVAIRADIVYVLVRISEGIYKGQDHVISMKLSDITNKYPMIAPYTTFITSIYHPNISTDGNICVDILGANWSPISNLTTVINSIMVALLNDGNPASALNGNAARDYGKANFSDISMKYYAGAYNHLRIKSLFPNYI